MWPWYSWHRFVAPSTPTSTDPGVFYEITTGETQTTVRAHVGEPRTITSDPAGQGNDAWAYPFGTIRFHQGRVANVVFNQNAHGTNYYEQMWRMRWP